MHLAELQSAFLHFKLKDLYLTFIIISIVITICALPNVLTIQNYTLMASISI